MITKFNTYINENKNIDLQIYLVILKYSNYSTIGINTNSFKTTINDFILSKIYKKYKKYITTHNRDNINLKLNELQTIFLIGYLLSINIEVSNLYNNINKHIKITFENTVDNINIDINNFLDILPIDFEENTIYSFIEKNKDNYNIMFFFFKKGILDYIKDNDVIKKFDNFINAKKFDLL